MKRLRLVNYFVCLFILFLELKLLGNNSQPHCFSPALKRFKTLHIYYYFYINLDFILSVTTFVAVRFIMNLF